MSKEILNLEPKAVWENFYQLTQIPRPSKKEAKIIAYMKNFGEKLGLETIIDEVENVIIRKPASPGFENRKGVVLQGHLDMVPQANSDSNHNFETDPIDAYVDGDWVTARGTTLGADNGMGCAAMMTILQSKDLQHGPIECLFTIDEETGMTGAEGLKPGFLKGDILINTDSEDEGELYFGCAGGVDANVNMNYTEIDVPQGMQAYKLNLTGLKGGHSGMDIILGRGNSNKLLVRFIKHAIQSHGLRLANFTGGTLRNAIPRESFATVVVPVSAEKEFTECLKKYEALYISELSATEPNLSFKAEKTAMPSKIMEETAQFKFVNSVYACPNGVIRMSDAMPGVVETSLNLAIVKAENGNMTVNCLLRSAVDSAKEDLGAMVASVFELIGAEVALEGSYPGWKPNPTSPILQTMKDVYHKMYGKTPDTKVIHAGLECGILGAAYPNWDMISFGPTIRFPHSPDEKVKIDTVQKFWDFLVETLKNIPVK
ncbi:MAG: aminoacyl-histidine dipeptidase [Bacteroidales bacterium]|nr:aminoacyl-histidine dipeptidase [Bacteroidales bacterium]